MGFEEALMFLTVQTLPLFISSRLCLLNCVYNYGTRMKHALKRWIALMRASVTGKAECVKVLLDRGAEVNMQYDVSGVIIHCVHALQHIVGVPSSG